MTVLTPDEVVAELTVDQPRGVAQQILNDHRPFLRLERQHRFTCRRVGG